MSLKPAKCPECGGLIDVDIKKRAAICIYCGQPFVIEDAIQTFNTYYNTTNHNYGTGSVVNVYETPNRDFVIEAGVLKEYHGASMDIVIPDGVEKIDYKCFSGLKIKSIIFPDSITHIGENAFTNCDALTNLTLPNSITNIGYCAFAGCTNLTTITIPDSVTSIDDYAFARCEKLTAITIHDGVNNIGSHVFDNCINLLSIVIPNSVTNIGSGAFAGCTNLSSVIIGVGVVIVGSDIFNNCVKLERIEWNAKSIESKFFNLGRDLGINGSGIKLICGDSVEIIPENFCLDIKHLKTVIMGNHVTEIGSNAFNGCSNLNNITISNSLIKIGANAFAHCSNLPTINIPNSVQMISYEAFWGCCCLDDINIPNSVTFIGDGAFEQCTNLKNINISIDLLLKYFYSFSLEVRRIKFRENGLCQYCGNEFKGLFISKCIRCGKQKDY